MFRGLAEEFWRDHLRSHPLSATLMGFRDHDDRMPDVTPEGRASLRRRLVGFLDRTRCLEPGDLAPEESVSHAALVAELEERIADLDCDLEAWTLDPLAGPQVTLLQLPGLQTAENRDRRDALTARYRACGPYLDAVRTNLERSVGEGRTPAASAAARVDRQLRGIVERPLEDWEHLRALREPTGSPAGWAPGDRARFEEEVERSVREDIRPAFARLARTVEQQVLPRARPEDEVGLLRLPGGEAAYRRCIRVHTSLELEPEEIHAFGLESLAEIRDALRDLGSRVLGTSDLAALLSRLRGDPDLHFRDRDEIESTARTALQRARDALPRALGRLPVADCEIRRVEPFEEADSTIAYYRQPAADGARPGAYYVNTYAPTTRPRYEAEALAYHESIPGHHVQIALAQEQEDLPEFRRHLGSTAYVEGWGLYAELLAEELGLYTGDLDRIGRLSFDAWRASRLVVDTGMHALGWSRRQAVDFMLENTALAENNIVNEVDRYIVWPGQALAYKIGQREILRLRARAERCLAGAFDRRAFHDQVLAHGAVGLPLLREQVEAWMTQNSTPAW